MSDEALDQKFWERADAIIELANQQSDESSVGEVSSSLLFAAARFNAFDVAVSALGVDELKADKDEAIRFLSRQYSSALAESFDDLIENFDSYQSP